MDVCLGSLSQRSPKQEKGLDEVHNLTQPNHKFTHIQDCNEREFITHRQAILLICYRLHQFWYPNGLVGDLRVLGHNGTELFPIQSFPLHQGVG